MAQSSMHVPTQDQARFLNFNSTAPQQANQPIFQGFPLGRSEQPEKLIVTVIPLEAHLPPYEMSVDFYPD